MILLGSPKLHTLFKGASYTVIQATQKAFSTTIFAHERARRSCHLYQLYEPVPFQTSWIWQKNILEQRLRKDKRDTRDVLLLLQHLPVYTLGRGSSLKNVKFDSSTPNHPPLVRIDRGGEVTYHCPGQIIGYPLLDLTYYHRDLHWYLRQIEEVIIQVLKLYNLKGERDKDFTGVWVEGKKVAAIGINANRWHTSHGFALNVCPEMSGFDAIIPCGIEGRPVGRLIDWIPEINLTLVMQQLVNSFNNVFNVKCIPCEFSPLTKSPVLYENN